MRKPRLHAVAREQQDSNACAHARDRQSLQCSDTRAIACSKPVFLVTVTPTPTPGHVDGKLRRHLKALLRHFPHERYGMRCVDVQVVTTCMARRGPTGHAAASVASPRPHRCGRVNVRKAEGVTGVTPAPLAGKGNMNHKCSKYGNIGHMDGGPSRFFAQLYIYAGKRRPSGT